MQMIDTAYRPEGALGALFSGFNAASAEEDQKQNLIREFLANQREQQAQPFDQMGKRYEGLLAQAKADSPTYIPSALSGYEGQMRSQDAAGRKAQATYDGDVAAQQVENRNRLTQAEIVETLNRLKKAGVVGTSGFNMQPQITGTAPGNGFFGNREAVAKELQALPEGPDKQAALAQFSQQVQQPDQGQEYEQAMQALVDTPEFRQKRLLGSDKTQAALEGIGARNEAMLEAARLKAQNEKQATVSQFRAQMYKIATGQEPTATPEDVAKAKAALAQMTEDDMAKAAANWKPGMDLSAYGVKMQPAPIDKQKAASAQTKTINGIDYVKVDGGWKKK